MFTKLNYKYRTCKILKYFNKCLTNWTDHSSHQPGTRCRAMVVVKLCEHQAQQPAEANLPSSCPCRLSTTEADARSPELRRSLPEIIPVRIQLTCCLNHDCIQATIYRNEC